MAGFSAEDARSARHVKVFDTTYVPILWPYERLDGWLLDDPDILQTIPMP